MLYRFREAQAAELGLAQRSDRRPRVASSCKDLRQCERWRGEILRDISRKVSKIQDGAFPALCPRRLGIRRRADLLAPLPPSPLPSRSALSSTLSLSLSYFAQSSQPLLLSPTTPPPTPSTSAPNRSTRPSPRSRPDRLRGARPERRDQQAPAREAPLGEPDHCARRRQLQARRGQDHGPGRARGARPEGLQVRLARALSSLGLPSSYIEGRLCVEVVHWVQRTLTPLAPAPAGTLAARATCPACATCLRAPRPTRTSSSRTRSSR